MVKRRPRHSNGAISHVHPSLPVLKLCLLQGLWTPGVSAIQPTLSRLVSFAAEQGVALVPYVYPILGFSNDPLAKQWLYPPRNYANLGSRLFQDYFINITLEFRRSLPTVRYSLHLF